MDILDHFDDTSQGYDVTFDVGTQNGLDIKTMLREVKTILELENFRDGISKGYHFLI